MLRDVTVTPGVYPWVFSQNYYIILYFLTPSMRPKLPNTNPRHRLDAQVAHAPPLRDINPLPHVCLIAQTNEVIKASVEHLHGRKQSFVQYMMGHCREKQLRMSPMPLEGVGRVRDGDRGGTERVAAAVALRWRWGWYREGNGGGMEKVAAVACRGWVDSMGSTSLWAGSMLGL